MERLTCRPKGRRSQPGAAGRAAGRHPAGREQMGIRPGHPRCADGGPAMRSAADLRRLSAAGPGMGVSSGLRSLLGVCDAPLSAPVGVGPPGHSGGVAGRHRDAGPSAPPPMDTPARKQIASAHCTLWLAYSRRRFFHILSSGLTDFPAAAPDFPASATHTWHRHPDRPGRYCGRSGRAPFSPRRPLRCCPPPDGWKTRYTTP